PWMDFPAVRGTLEQWGFLEPDSPQSQVFEKFRVRVTKIQLMSRSPLAAILNYLEQHPTDLIVLATEGRNGLPRWIQPSIGERIAERSGAMTLFVPQNSLGIVSPADGSFSLRQILIPIAHSPSPQPAVECAISVADMIGQLVKVTLLHVGDSEDIPKVHLRQDPIITWETVCLNGNIVENITKTADKLVADLVVMSTVGHDGFLDALRGSVTEQVLRRLSCPLLAIPATSRRF
ncbi:universal stress protein, partial [Acidobacteria bacterium AH-259-D05]|nr:universal stress protein [Acidobacteria bacterium AH-259-D05]